MINYFLDWDIHANMHILLAAPKTKPSFGIAQQQPKRLVFKRILALLIK